ncbi:MAG: AAA domain-containing protein [Chloroflexales bacterium]|nr:AAA domain-containing protein [Chloroflexales bacterium]
MHVLRAPNGTNFRVNSDEWAALQEILERSSPPGPTSGLNPFYPLADCAGDTGITEAELARWLRAIERKGQAVLYGPPGTGKTFVAQRLARHLVGGGEGFVELVQFHPAYSYEDFIQGIRPQSLADGSLTYPMVPGRFLDFCARARAVTDTCILIVDEINRANLARVFGELMYLLEYRDQSLPLAGGGVLSIPANVRIIGTMNTADRSIALVDHALRRRFAFLPLQPNYAVLRQFQSERDFDADGLVSTLEQVNREIGDSSYAVGISFFMRPGLADALEDIWRMEIEPYLEEYFFDRREVFERFRWEKISARVTL